MFRVSGLWTAVGAVIGGLIIADLLTHPTGTKAVASGINTLEKQTGNQLLGKTA